MRSRADACSLCFAASKSRSRSWSNRAANRSRIARTSWMISSSITDSLRSGRFMASATPLMYSSQEDHTVFPDTSFASFPSKKLSPRLPCTLYRSSIYSGCDPRLRQQDCSACLRCNEQPTRAKDPERATREGAPPSRSAQRSTGARFPSDTSRESAGKIVRRFTRILEPTNQ